MTLEYLAGKRTREGGPLLVFGPLAVTTELPVLSRRGGPREGAEGRRVLPGPDGPGAVHVEHDQPRRAAREHPRDARGSAGRLSPPRPPAPPPYSASPRNASTARHMRSGFNQPAVRVHPPVDFHHACLRRQGPQPLHRRHGPRIAGIVRLRQHQQRAGHAPVVLLEAILEILLHVVELRLLPEPARECSRRPPRARRIAPSPRHARSTSRFPRGPCGCFPPAHRPRERRLRELPASSPAGAPRAPGTPAPSLPRRRTGRARCTARRRRPARSPSRDDRPPWRVPPPRPASCRRRGPARSRDRP